MDAFLTKHGRRMVGWDEILQGGLAAGGDGDELARDQRRDHRGPGRTRRGHGPHFAHLLRLPPASRRTRARAKCHRPWRRSTPSNRFPPTLNAQQAKHVLGGQGQLWGELIADRQRRDFMTWPRACALSRNALVAAGRAATSICSCFGSTRTCERLTAAGIGLPAARSQADAVDGEDRCRRSPRRPGPARRLLPDHVERFTFEVIPPEAGRDVFEIETRERQGRHSRQHRRVDGDGTELVSQAPLPLPRLAGAADQLDLPDPLPEVEPKVRRVSWAKHRYFLNYCCFGYSLPWWDWAQWERLIDWMALNGINTPLAVTGQEAVWQAVGKRLGLTDEQMQAFLAGPPYLPFGWMGCLDGWGGPLAGQTGSTATNSLRSRSSPGNASWA